MGLFCLEDCWFLDYGSTLVDLYRPDAPAPMFIGEVLSVFRFLW